MLLITIIGTAFPLMWVDFWRFFGSVLEKAWKGAPWVLEVISHVQLNASVSWDTGWQDRNWKWWWKVSGTQGRGRPMNCFIYLFIYLSFFEPPPCLCDNCLFLLRQIYPWVLYNSHISLFPVPVLENLINERTWLVTHMTYLVLKKSFICLL